MSEPVVTTKNIEGFQTTVLDYNCDGGKKKHEIVFFFLHGLGAEASHDAFVGLPKVAARVPPSRGGPLPFVRPSVAARARILDPF